MFYHAFTIEHSVEKPVEELGDVMMSPLFHRVSAVCPVLHVFGILHIPCDVADSSSPDPALMTTTTSTTESAVPIPRPSPGPLNAATVASGATNAVTPLSGSTPGHHASTSTPRTQTLLQSEELPHKDDARLVQRHACLHIHGIFPYFYVPQYDDSISPTQFGAQLESVALRHAFLSEDRRAHAPRQANRPPPPAATAMSIAAEHRFGESAHEPRTGAPPTAPVHRQLLHNVELVRRVPFYGYHGAPHLFFKISVIDPAHVPPLVELLRDTTHVGQRTWQPYESHQRFHSQFMMDSGISGMAPFRLHRCAVRCPVPPELAMLLPPPAHALTSEADAAVRARRQALGVTAVALPDERERLSASEVELDVRASDLLLGAGSHAVDGAAPHAQTVDTATGHRAPIGAHLAHTRRSLKQYFHHHGVPDALRVADTMEVEARVQESMRRGHPLAKAHPAKPETAATLRYGTVEQIQRNDPAACAMRAHMRDHVTSAAWNSTTGAVTSRSKDEVKSEKPTFWLMKQQQQQGSASPSRKTDGTRCPWAEMDPLGPPCSLPAIDHTRTSTAATGKATVSQDQDADELTHADLAAARLSSGDNVPLTFELLDALAKPLSCGTAVDEEAQGSPPEAPAGPNANGSGSGAAVDANRGSDTPLFPKASMTAAAAALPSVDDTVAFVLRTTRLPTTTRETPPRARTASHSPSLSHEGAPTNVTLRVLAAGRVSAIDSATGTAVIQWCVSLPETHLAAEARALVRRHQWMPPEATVRVRAATEGEAASLVLAAGEWLLTEVAAPMDRVPLTTLRYPTRLPGLEAAAAASRGGAGVRVELLACPLCLFHDRESYHRATVRGDGAMTHAESAPAVVVMALCRYEYSFQSRLLRPLEGRHVSWLTRPIRSSDGLARPHSWHKAKEEKQEEEAGEGGAAGQAAARPPLPQTQRGSFLLLPEPFDDWPPRAATAGRAPLSSDGTKGDEGLGSGEARHSRTGPLSASSSSPESAQSSLLDTSSASSGWSSVAGLFTPPSETGSGRVPSVDRTEGVLLTTPLSSSVASTPDVSAHAEDNVGDPQRVRWSCQPVRSAAELADLLTHLPFSRSITRAKEAADVVLTQGQLLRRVSTCDGHARDQEPEKVVVHYEAGRAEPLTPPAPWQRLKRPRETLTPGGDTAQSGWLRTPSHGFAEPDGEEDAPLLPFDDSPVRPRVATAAPAQVTSRAATPPPAPVVTCGSSALSPESPPRRESDVELLTGMSSSPAVVLSSSTHVHHSGAVTVVVADEDDAVESTKADRQTRHAELVHSHSVSPLSVEVVVEDELTECPVRWQPTHTPADPTAKQVLHAAAPCAPSTSETHIASHAFLRRRTSATTGSSACVVSAATWPLPATAPLPFSATPAETPPRPATTKATSPSSPTTKAAETSADAASAPRRSTTTPPSHHSLTCNLRLLHVEVLVRRREATQQVAGDPLLAVALGQSTTDSTAIAPLVLCVAPTTSTSTTGAPSASPFCAGAPPAASHSSASVRPEHAPAPGERTWRLTDRVNVVELPTERALLLRTQHEIAQYDPDIIVSWEGFKYGIGLISLRYRAVLGRSLARDLSRLRPIERVVDELTHQHRRDARSHDTDPGVGPSAHVVPRVRRAPFHVSGLTPLSSPVADFATRGTVRQAKREEATPATVDDDEEDIDEDGDDDALAVAAYNLNLEEEATDAQTAIAKRYAKRFGATVRIIGRVVSSVSRDIRKGVKLASHTLSHAHAELIGETLPYFSDATLAHMYDFDGGSGASCGCGHRCFVLRYLLTNVIATHRMARKLHYYTRAMEFSRLYGVLYEESMTRGSQFKVEATLCRLARPQGYLMISPSIGATHRQPRIHRIPLIMQPRSDLYKDPVVVLDFRSLYPSIVIAYNLCYSTCMGLVQPHACGRLGVLPRYHRDTALLRDLLLGEPTSPTDTTTTTTHRESDSLSATPPPVAPLGLVVAPNGAMFVPPFVREGVLPQMLRTVLDTRVEIQAADKYIAKPQHDEFMQTRLQEQQLALKLLANTTYGYTAASFTGRMPCVDVAEAIVSLGRQTLERAIALVHERTEWRAEVVYGDTDSLFVHLPGRTREEAFAVGEAMAKAVTASNPSPVTLQFEKILQPCLLLVKKRYTGYAWFTREQRRPSFLAKGIETVRRDQCPATVELADTLLHALFDGASATQLRSRYTAEVLKLRQPTANVSAFIFRRAVKLARYGDERHLPLAARLALKQMQKDLLQTPFWGERLPYVVCRSLLSTKLKDQVVVPQELIATSNRLTIDTEYYMQRHINAVLDRLFYVVGISFSRWYTEVARRGQWSSYLDVDAFMALQSHRRAARHGRGPSYDRASRLSQISPSSSARDVDETSEDDGRAYDQPVNVEDVVGATQATLSPITVDDLSQLTNLAHPTSTSVIDIDATDADDDVITQDREDQTNRAHALRPPPPSHSAPPATRTMMATQRVDGMRTLDRYYPRARCVVCDQHSVTSNEHQEQLNAALDRARRHRRHKHQHNAPPPPDISTRAVPPICASCWADPLTLLTRVQRHHATVAHRLHMLEEACQVCMGSLGTTGGPTYLRAVHDLEELPPTLAPRHPTRRPSSSGVPRDLTHPVAFLTVAEAKRAAARAQDAQAEADGDTAEGARVEESTFGCVSIDCDIAFEKRTLLLQRTQLQVLSWYLHDVL